MSNINTKLGNMRKAVDWTVCPAVTGHESNEITIQSDKRIAKINIDTKKAILSDGKGGHPGFHKLSAFLGATEVDVSEELITEIKEKQPQKGDRIGSPGGISIIIG